MKLSINQLGGQNNKVAGHLLKNNEAQVALDVLLTSGTVGSWRKPAQAFSRSETGIQSITKWTHIPAGIGAPTFDWIVYTTPHDSVLSPIAGDAFERIYFLGSTPSSSMNFHLYANDFIADPFVQADKDLPAVLDAPSAACAFVSGHTGGTKYRAYVYTYVSRYGEETAPSPVLSTSVYNTGNIVLGTFEEPPEHQLKTRTAAVPSGYNEPKIRLYRTSSTTDGVGAFRFVKDTNVNGVTWSTFQITDDVAENALGEVIPSVDWAAPSNAMFCLRAMPQGWFAACKTNSVVFSEPFLAHAWPSEYEVTFSEDVVGIEVVGTSLIVMTNSSPYLLYGEHPSDLTKLELQGYYPCLNRHGAVRTSSGVIYPSVAGFLLVDQNGVKNLTADVLTQEDMVAYTDDKFTAVYWDGMYIAFWMATIWGGLILDLEDGKMHELTLHGGAFFRDTTLRKLYFAGKDLGTTTESIYEWDGDDYNFMEYTWKSKKFIMPQEMNFSCARIITDPNFYTSKLELLEDNSYLATLNATLITGDILGSINASAVNVQDVNGSILYKLEGLSLSPYITFSLYVDDVLRYTCTVENNRPFRLPAGYRGKQIEIQVSGYAPIQEISLANSIREIMSNG